MANGIGESEEEFSEQFVLDDDSLDDLSLDDDALFADLDNEIRLDGDGGEASKEDGVGEIAAPEEGGNDLDLDFDVEDMGASDSGPADEGDAESLEADGGEELGDPIEGLSAEDASEDLAVDSSVGDGLDDLLGDVPGSDGLDDLLGDGATDDAADDGLGDILGDDAADDGLGNLLGDEAAEPPREEVMADDGGIDVNAIEDELTLDDPDEETDGADFLADEDIAELDPDGAGSVDDDLGDLNLDLGAEEITLDDGVEETAAEAPATEDIGEEELGEEQFELPPLEEEPSAEDVAMSAEEEEEVFAGLEDDSLDSPPEVDLSMTVSVGDENMKVEDVPDENLEKEEPFVAAPDVDVEDLDFQLDSLDGSVEAEGAAPDEPEDDGFSVSDIPAFDAAEVEKDDGENFTAVADLELSDENVLELGVENLDGAEGGSFSNMPAPSSEDLLEVPLEGPPAQPSIAAAQPGGVPTLAAVPAQPQEVVGISTDVLLSVSHQINVEMGPISLRGQDILDLNYGSVVPLERSVGEPVNLMLGGRTIAQGEIVLINGKNLGVRIVAVNK